MEFRPWGKVDPFFPACGQVYLSSNGFYVNDVHGGPQRRKWIDENFQANEDDIYVVSFPKTGTTWLQEIVYVIVNNLDFEKSKSQLLTERFPYLELSFENETIPYLPRPRLIKSHYPYSLLPNSIIDKKCKILYPIRNPKDTLVSYYHFVLINPVFKYNGDFETFFNFFINDERITYSPFSKHILEMWEQRNKENIFIVHYEDMKMDAKKEIRRVAEFLGRPLTDEQVESVANHCSFKSMKANPSTNGTDFFEKGEFMRKGEVGDWKNYFTEEMNRKMDEYVEKHFKNSGLEFTYLI